MKNYSDLASKVENMPDETLISVYNALMDTDPLTLGPKGWHEKYYDYGDCTWDDWGLIVNSEMDIRRLK